jgi:dTDP-4-dehydrorhamnose reductase
MIPPNRLPLLITGVTGVAGFNALAYFRARYPGRIVATMGLQSQFDSDGVVPLASEDRRGLVDLFRRHNFRSVLNTTGNCALKSCELDPPMAHRLNVVSAANLATVARQFGARLVHLSSDLVFSGRGNGGYVETAPVDPVTVYGKTMAAGEHLVLTSCPSAAVLRISLPMGPSSSRHAGAIDWIQSRFRAGRPATLYFDEVRSCTYVADLNRVFEFFLANDASGLHHAGGPRAVTLFQIAQIVNRVGGYDPNLLKGCPRLDAGPIPPRAGNVSMNSAKLHALMGRDPFRPWPLGDDIFPLDRRWHFDRPARDDNGPERLRARLYHYAASDRGPSSLAPAMAF